MFKRFLYVFFIFFFVAFSFGCHKKKYSVDESNIVIKPIFEEKITADIQSVIDLSYSFKFSNALKKIESLRKTNEDPYVLDLLMVGCLFWQYIAAITEEENNYAREQFTTLTEDIKDRMNKALTNEPDNLKALYLLGFTEGSQSKFYAIEGDFFKAYRFGVKGYARLRKIEKINPNDYDTQFGIGLYKYYCATLLPKWFQNLSFIVPGIDIDQEGGYMRVLYASKYAKFLKVEADLTLAQGNASFEREYKKGVEISERIVKTYPENKVFAYTHNISLYYLGLQYFYDSKPEKAIKIFSKVLKRANDKQAFRLKIRRKYYLMPDMRWRMNLPAEHEVLFMAYRELGKIYFYNGEFSEADAIFKEGANRIILGNEIRAVLLFEIGKLHKILDLADANQFFQDALGLVSEKSEIGAACKTLMQPNYKMPEAEVELFKICQKIAKNKVSAQEVLDVKNKLNRTDATLYQYKFYEILYQLYDLNEEPKLAEKYQYEVRVHHQLER